MLTLEAYHQICIIQWLAFVLDFVPSLKKKGKQKSRYSQKPPPSVPTALNVTIQIFCAQSQASLFPHTFLESNLPLKK